MVGNPEAGATVTAESLRAEGLTPGQVLQHLGLKRLGTVRNQLLETTKGEYNETTLFDTVVPLWGLKISQLFEFIDNLGIFYNFGVGEPSALTGKQFFQLWLLGSEFPSQRFVVDETVLAEQRKKLQFLQQIAKGEVEVEELTTAAYAGADQDRYEFSYDNLLAQLGFGHVTQVQKWLAEQDWRNPTKKIVISNWGITLNQLVSVLNALKPKLRPNPEFTRLFSASRTKKTKLKQTYTQQIEHEVFIRLAGQEFLQGWLTNSATAKTVRVNGEDISGAIELIKLYRATNKLDGTVAK